MIRRVTSIAALVCAFAFAKEASAQMQTVVMQPAQPQTVVMVAPSEGVDRAGGIVNALVGFGTRAGTGFGLGIEGGYTLPMHLYLGGMFTYDFGSDDITAYLFEAQVGYDLGVIKAAPVLIRPYIGLGYENYVYGGGTTCIEGQCVTVTGAVGGGGAVISPGVMGAYFFTPHWFAGVDLRIDIDAGGYGGALFNFAATGGYKF